MQVRKVDNKDNQLDENDNDKNAIRSHSLKILFLIFHCSRHFNHSASTLAMSSGVGTKISAELVDNERNGAIFASSVSNSVSSVVR